METLQAIAITAWFLVKLAGFATFVVGAVTVWKWVTDRYDFSLFSDEDEDEVGVAPHPRWDDLLR